MALLCQVIAKRQDDSLLSALSLIALQARRHERLLGPPLLDGDIFDAGLVDKVEP